MFHPAKKLPAGQYALALGEVHTAMRTPHHILGIGQALRGIAFAVFPDQQINHRRNGNQQKQIDPVRQVCRQQATRIIFRKLLRAARLVHLHADPAHLVVRSFVASVEALLFGAIGILPAPGKA